MSGAGIAALRRLSGRHLSAEEISDGREPGATPAHATCGLCAQPLAPTHEHLVEPRSRAIECACQACAILFDHEAETRYARVGRDVVEVPADEVRGAWAALDLPISLAFVARWSMSGDERADPPVVVATSPSPLGVVDHPVREDLFERLATAHPAVARLRPDVEALLVYQGPPLRAFVLPIDRCFALAGEVRRARRGLSMGPPGAEAIEAFLDELERGGRGRSGGR